MYNLILPLETCQHLIKRCCLGNMKFTFSRLTVIKCIWDVTAGQQTHSDSFIYPTERHLLRIIKFNTWKGKKITVNMTVILKVCSAYFVTVYISLQRDGYGPIEVPEINFNSRNGPEMKFSCCIPCSPSAHRPRISAQTF